MAPEFVTLDFETANEMRGSACQIGLVKMDTDGQIVDSFSSLIHPDPGYEHFRQINIAIHGITADMVADSPSMAELAPQITEFIGELPVVAHNMAFDYSVWNSHVASGNLPEFAVPRLCTLRIARQLLHRPTGTNDLEQLVADFLPDETFNHHDAAADAGVTGKLFLAMIAHLDTTLEQLVDSFALTLNRRSIASGRKSRPTELEINLDNWEDTSILQDETICFTGTLARVKRDDAHALVEHLGGAFSKGVTKKTTKLVIGVPNPASWKPGSDGSSKMVKARALADKGSLITVMTEDEFFAWVGDMQ